MIYKNACQQLFDIDNHYCFYYNLPHLPLPKVKPQNTRNRSFTTPDYIFQLLKFKQILQHFCSHLKMTKPKRNSHRCRKRLYLLLKTVASRGGLKVNEINNLQGSVRYV